MKTDNTLNENIINENTIGGLLNKASRILTDAGVDNGKAEARFLMEHVSGIRLEVLYAKYNEVLDDVTRRRYMNAVKKRTTHYPLQYILGYTYFMDYKFICRENVLIPRFDTETLSLHALELAPRSDAKVLDMCTGSGCIGITHYLEREREGYIDDVTLCDISDDAVRLARDNAESLGAKVKVIKSDLFSGLRDEDGRPTEKYNLILSNPPYIKTFEINFLIKDVRDYEPRLALDGSKDGLRFYRLIIRQAKEFLKPGGSLVLEIGYEQYMDVADILRNEGYRRIRKLTDMSQLDRVVSACYD